MERRWRIKVLRSGSSLYRDDLPTIKTIYTLLSFVPPSFVTAK